MPPGFSLRKETWVLLAVVLPPVLMILGGIAWGLPGARESSVVMSGEPSDRSALFDAAARDLRRREAGHPSASPLQEAPRGAALSEIEEERLKAYRRFLLFSAHPDEMQVFLGIAALDPQEGRWNPRLYHYGGAFLYPIAALIKAASWVWLVELRRDLDFYLRNPDEFARFYVIGRLFVLAFYAWGIALAFRIGQEWGGAGRRGLAWGVVAGLLFAWLPANVAFALELKPHLPGSVLLLAAFRWRRRFWLSCLFLGLAAGMSPWFAAAWMLLVPMTWRDERVWEIRRFALGAGIAVLAFLVANPYFIADWPTFLAEFRRDSRWYVPRSPVGGMADFLTGSFAAAVTPLGVLLAPFLAVFAVRRYGQTGAAWLAGLGIPFLLIAAAMSSRPEDLTRARFGFLFYPYLVLLVLSAALWLWERSRAGAAVLLGVTGGAFAFGAWPYVENAWRASGTGGTRRECAEWIYSHYPRGTTVAVRDAIAPCNFPPISINYYRIVWTGHPMAVESPIDLQIVQGPWGPEEPILDGYRLAKICRPERSCLGRWEIGPGMSWVAPEYRIYERAVTGRSPSRD